MSSQEDEKRFILAWLAKDPKLQDLVGPIHLNYSLDGSRNFSSQDIQECRQSVETFKRKDGIVPKDNPQVKVVSKIFEMSNGCTEPVEFSMRGDTTGKMLDWIGERYFDLNLDLSANLATGFEQLVGHGLGTAHGVDFERYQLDISITGQGIQANQLTVALAFRPIPKNVS